MGILFYFFLSPHPCCLFLLQSIEEVGGYVLIALNTVSRIHLDKLRIIRGHSLFEKKFALYVIANFQKNKGTRELRLNSLTGLSLHPNVTKQNFYVFVCVLNIRVCAAFRDSKGRRKNLKQAALQR